MPRLDPPAPDAMTPRQREVHDAIANGPRGGARGPFGPWLHSPEFADRAQALGKYLRFDSNLPLRLSELSIITTGRLWRSSFEWQIHSGIALENGISAEIIESIRRRETPKFDKADEQVVYDFTLALHTDRKVTQALYDRAVAVLGEPSVVDLVGLCGYYTLISMTLNVFEVTPLEENPSEFE